MEGRIKDAVRTVFSRLDGSGILWCLAGSVNMQLQGIQVESHDLDVVVQHKDLEKVSLLFSDYSATPVRRMEKTFSGQLVWEVVAYINNIKVQFFGSDEDDIYVGKLIAGMTTKVSIDEIKVPCFTLEAEMKSYLETNREHKAKIIKDFLSMRSKESYT
jgi:predicted nucleotidyltransferase